MPVPDKPEKRPVIRAVSFDEAGAAIGRLLAITQSDTGQSAKVADFLLAWWNGPDIGHSPVLHLRNVDEVIGEDMLVVMAYLVTQPVTYANAWGYESPIRELRDQWRGEA